MTNFAKSAACSKVLNSEFCLCPHSKPHPQNSCTDSQDFLTQTAQGSKHEIKNEILNMVDTFLNMTTDSPVPVLSGTHSRPISKNQRDIRLFK